MGMLVSYQKYTPARHLTCWYLWRHLGARYCLVFLLSFLCFSVTPSYGLDPGEALRDPVLEKRARALAAELRCMVCQNQSIDDSDAELARDLRRLVRERLVAGDSDQKIRAMIVERYGEFALFRPRVSAKTYVLWGMPFALLMLGLLVLWRLLAKRPA